MKKTGIENIIEYIYEEREHLYTPLAMEKVRLCVLDELGCGIYGSRMPEAQMIMQAFINMQEQGEVPVWGAGKTFSMAAAAFINGSLCHMRELDDVHFAILHTGAVCVPAAMAAAQVCGSTIGELMKAVIVGVEVTVRISQGMNFLNHRERGWHGTATCGAFGAAAAAGILLHLSKEEMADALGIAGSRTGGTWAFAKDGAMTKRLHPGMAARDGIISAFLAKQGVKGPHYILEAEDGGFYRVMTDSFDLEGLDKKEHPAIEDIEYKWFASCKSVHSPFMAAAEIFEQNRERKQEDIELINVYVNRSAIEMAGGGYNPESVVSAQISIPYGVALGLWGYTGTAEDYTEERLHEKNLFRTAQMVNVEESEDMNILRRKEKRSAAVITVQWKDGYTDTAFVKAPKGSMFCPLTTKDILGKFYKLAEPAMGEEKTRKIQELVMYGDYEKPVSELAKIVTGG